MAPAIEPAQLTAALAAFERVPVRRPELRPAAVAVCIRQTASGDALLITRRARGLRNHAGQWALPGGRRDPGETCEDAARRELAEETGLAVPPAAVLGLLDDYVTRSGYLMTPVVVWGAGATGQLAAQPAEVASIFEVPLDDLDVEPEFLTLPETAAPVIRLPLLDRYVHAPTAAIIYQFCQLALHGRTQRVAQFEAPAFLWR